MHATARRAYSAVLEIMIFLKILENSGDVHLDVQIYNLYFCVQI